MKDRLIIFVEAQSTWTINILVRILLYLSATYHEYIIDHDMNVYTSRKLELPEPEFYVVYTGSPRADCETISLREDFWHNPNAKLDLTVRVIQSESREDIIGQYIIFAHVLDGQIRLHGRKKIAVEETIRICQDSGALSEYLEGRKKEVVDIMVTLFNQEYAMEVYGREQKRDGKIEGAVEMCQKFGATIEEAIRKIAANFGLTEEASSKYVRKFWQN